MSLPHVRRTQTGQKKVLTQCNKNSYTTPKEVSSTSPMEQHSAQKCTANLLFQLPKVRGVLPKESLCTLLEARHPLILLKIGNIYLKNTTLCYFSK